MSGVRRGPRRIEDGACRPTSRCRKRRPECDPVSGQDVLSRPFHLGRGDLSRRRARRDRCLRLERRQLVQARTTGDHGRKAHGAGVSVGLPGQPPALRPPPRIQAADAHAHARLQHPAPPPRRRHDPAETSITSGPASSTTSTGELRLHLDRVRLELRLQARRRRWAACTSPRPTRASAIGSHQFSVRATDAAGNVDADPGDAELDGRSVGTAAATPRRPRPRSRAGRASTHHLDLGQLRPSRQRGRLDLRLQARRRQLGQLRLAEGLLRPRPSAPTPSRSVPPTPPATSTPRRRRRPGRCESASATAADTTPPDTSITSGPAASTTSTSASFAFSRDRARLQLRMQARQRQLGGCASPKAYSGLAVGSHHFSVRATDAAGNVDATPATQTWTVEAATPPPRPTATERLHHHRHQHLRRPVRRLLRRARLGRLPGRRLLRQVTLSATKAAPGVTLRAQNPGQATIAGATLGGSHLTLARFVVTNGVSIPGPRSHRRSNTTASPAAARESTPAPPPLTWCTEMRIIGNQLIGPFGEDAIHANRYHGLYVEGNEITKVRENGDHSDCLQTVWRGDHIFFRATTCTTTAARGSSSRTRP